MTFYAVWDRWTGEWLRDASGKVPTFQYATLAERFIPPTWNENDEPETDRFEVRTYN